MSKKEQNLKNNAKVSNKNKKIKIENASASSAVSNKKSMIDEINESFEKNINQIEEQMNEIFNDFDENMFQDFELKKQGLEESFGEYENKDNNREDSLENFEEDSKFGEDNFGYNNEFFPEELKTEARGEFVCGQSALTSYMKEMVDCKVVSKEEEDRMFKALQNGDKTMIDDIFKANARLVLYVVKRFAKTVEHNPSMSLEDLISAGNLGLLKAIGLFDPDKGYKFSTYAYHWIYSFAERAICNESNLIRIPVHLQDKARKVKKIEKELELKLNRELTHNERMELVENILGSQNVFAMEQYAMYSSPLSLNMLVNEEEDSSEFGDFVISMENNPEDVVIESTLKAEILQLMEECLPERNIKIMKMRFGFDSGVCMTLEEVGNIFGLTRERIRQIESKSIRLLRRNRKFRSLRHYINAH